MVKYHIATGDGKAYYGVNYESYREAEAVLRFSQKHDPPAHIVEEEYHFTNADRIRAMTDEELAKLLYEIDGLGYCKNLPECGELLDTDTGIPEEKCIGCMLNWLRQPAEVG